MKYIKILATLLAFTILNHKGISQVNCASEINLALTQQNNSARYQRILALEQHTQNYINPTSAAIPSCDTPTSAALPS